MYRFRDEEEIDGLKLNKKIDPGLVANAEALLPGIKAVLIMAGWKPHNTSS